LDLNLRDKLVNWYTCTIVIVMKIGHFGQYTCIRRTIKCLKCEAGEGRVRSLELVMLKLIRVLNTFKEEWKVLHRI
jgi:hypothetical protein